MNKKSSLSKNLAVIQAINPWDDFQQILKAGQLFDGVVTRVADTEVFIEIIPGVEGLLSKSRLPKWVRGSLPEIFWLGDRVLVSIDEVKNINREIFLGIPELDQRNFTQDEAITIHKLIHLDKSANRINTQQQEGSNSKHILSEKDSKQSLSRSRRQIEYFLNQLSDFLGFEIVILFSVDKANHDFSILECSGDRTVLNESALSQITFSLIRSVVEENALVIINDIRSPDRKQQARYLLELYPNLNACIGVPVITSLSKGFALFALDKIPHRKITPKQILYVRAIAEAVGAHQELQEIRERTVFIQRSALIGHLARSMVHEINNLLGPLYSRLDNLEFNLSRIKEKQDRVSLIDPAGTVVTNALAEIKSVLSRMVNTTRMFGRIMTMRDLGFLRVDEVITETIHLIRDLCDRSYIQISLTPPNDLIIVRSRSAVLGQILLSVLLNVVQEISELRSDLGGRVHIYIESSLEKKASNFFKILINDNGPGIHIDLWDRVFDAGYTTHADKGGLGLYISRNLAEDMGGRLYIQESHILSGTTVALEMPYYL